MPILDPLRNTLITPASADKSEGAWGLWVFGACRFFGSLVPKKIEHQTSKYQGNLSTQNRHVIEEPHSRHKISHRDRSNWAKVIKLLINTVISLGWLQSIPYSRTIKVSLWCLIKARVQFQACFQQLIKLKLSNRRNLEKRLCLNFYSLSLHASSLLMYNKTLIAALRISKDNSKTLLRQKRWTKRQHLHPC